MLKEVCVEELEDETLVLPEVDVFDQADDVVLVFRVFCHQEFEESCLLLGELVVDLRISVDFHGHSHPCHVVNS